MNGCHVVVIHLTTDNLDLIPVSLKLHLVDSHLVHFLDDTCIVWSQNLSTVAPVSLVTVVLLRVVRSSYVDTSLGTELTDSERNLRCRTEALEEISLDAIGREDGSYGLSEETGVVTAVVTYHYRKVLLTWESLEDVVSKALCSHTNDILVHAVGTCAHDTAQTTSTELQVLIECINESRLVLCVEHCLYFFTSFFVKSRCEPLLCSFFTLLDQFCVISHSLIILCN